MEGKTSEKKERKMRDSGIPWIGEVPEGWEFSKIKYHCTMKSGDNITALDISDNGEYPVYGGNGLRGFYKIYNKREESILAEELTIKFDEIHSDITNLMMLTDGLIYEHRLRIAECLREDILELIEVYETQIQVEQEATKKLMDMINRHIDRDVKEYKEKNNYPIKIKR